jgi:hypothetical protein
VSRAATLLAAAALAGACSSTPRPPPAVERTAVHRATGDEARAMGEPASAAYAYARALAAARAADDRKAVADAGYRLGAALVAAGQPVEAAVQLEDAAATARRIGDRALAARALLALARARQDARAGDVRGALEEALSLAVEAGEPTLGALAQLGLGASGPVAEAEGRYAKAEALAGRDPKVAGPLALNRARLAERRGDLRGAGPLFLAAAEAYRGLEDETGLWLALSGAARAADAEAGDARGAADLHRRAADAALFAGRTEAAAAELRLAAAAHRRAGEAPEAARRDAEARRLADDAAVERRTEALLGK